jgi:hypothetical protein
MTYFCEHTFRKEAENMDHQQDINLAHAAGNRIIEHYIWTALRHATEISDGKIPIPQMDGKAQVGKYIREKLPELAKQRTYLWLGLYVTNFVSSPLLEPNFLVRYYSNVSNSSRHRILRYMRLGTDLG